MYAPSRTKITVPSLRSRKNHGPAIVALTAYDFPTASALDEAGVDLLLVGDSAGMVVHGMENTLTVNLSDIILHTRAVARARPKALLTADMPFLTYHISTEETIRNAGALIQAGAEAVKLEGGMRRAPLIEALVSADIPVMGHLGLTPQAVHTMGGYRIQGKTPRAIQSLMEDLDAIEQAGAFSVVLEGIPVEVARLLTKAASIPTIGIGAGPHCDGQILVIHDLLGLSPSPPPRFARKYADLRTATMEAVRAYSRDVQAGTFPALHESYSPGLKVEKIEEDRPQSSNSGHGGMPAVKKNETGHLH
jgi:3-methyl-2-oxobutanoate hydroxymethyltransferase